MSTYHQGFGEKAATKFNPERMGFYRQFHIKHEHCSAKHISVAGPWHQLSCRCTGRSGKPERAKFAIDPDRIGQEAGQGLLDQRFDIACGKSPAITAVPGAADIIAAMLDHDGTSIELNENANFPSPR